MPTSTIAVSELRSGNTFQLEGERYTLIQMYERDTDCTIVAKYPSKFGWNWIELEMNLSDKVNLLQA